jgi:UDP-3-O-[3-hydroxymyristoyl] glucosamine N-acyltransferase
LPTTTDKQKINVKNAPLIRIANDNDARSAITASALCRNIAATPATCIYGRGCVIGATATISTSATIRPTAASETRCIIKPKNTVTAVAV